MPAHRNRVAKVSATNQSRVTNGTVILEGIDGRSPEGRRYRDLMRAYIIELGGEEGLSEARRALVRQAAGVAVASERMQAGIINGKRIDAEQLVRISNLLARLLRTLGIGQGGPVAAKPRTLAEHLADHEGRAA